MKTQINTCHDTIQEMYTRYGVTMYRASHREKGLHYHVSGHSYGFKCKEIADIAFNDQCKYGPYGAEYKADTEKAIAAANAA